jgi:hypothetical protein
MKMKINKHRITATRGGGLMKVYETRFLHDLVIAYANNSRDFNVKKKKKEWKDMGKTSREEDEDNNNNQKKNTL